MVTSVLDWFHVPSPDSRPRYGWAVALLALILSAASFQRLESHTKAILVLRIYYDGGDSRGIWAAPLAGSDSSAPFLYQLNQLQAMLVR
jgi:hypothetical protein